MIIARLALTLAFILAYQAFHLFLIIPDAHLLLALLTLEHYF